MGVAVYDVVNEPTYMKRNYTMKRLAFLAVLLLSVPGLAMANDEAAPVVSEPLAVATEGGACPAPAPVCDPKPEVCATSSEEIYHLVPKKKKVYETETYTVDQKQSRTEKQYYSKTIRGNSARLVRTARNHGRPAIEVYKDPDREKTYTKNVKVEYTVPVVKTRKIAKEVEEYELVPERKSRFRR